MSLTLLWNRTFQTIKIPRRKYENMKVTRRSPPLISPGSPSKTPHHGLVGLCSTQASNLLGEVRFYFRRRIASKNVVFSAGTGLIVAPRGELLFDRARRALGPEKAGLSLSLPGLSKSSSLQVCSVLFWMRNFLRVTRISRTVSLRNRVHSVVPVYRATPTVW